MISTNINQLSRENLSQVMAAINWYSIYLLTLRVEFNLTLVSKPMREATFDLNQALIDNVKFELLFYIKYY